MKVCGGFEADVAEQSFTQKPSKSDGRGQGCEVNEDDGSEDLRVYGIGVIADVVAVATLQVPYHSAERISCPHQRVLPRRLRGLINWNERFICAINDIVNDREQKKHDARGRG